MRTYFVNHFIFIVFLGYKLALRSMRQGQAKMIIISNNCPAVRKTELEYYAILCGSKVQYFDGNNVELGKELSPATQARLSSLVFYLL